MGYQTHCPLIRPRSRLRVWQTNWKELDHEKDPASNGPALNSGLSHRYWLSSAGNHSESQTCPSDTRLHGPAITGPGRYVRVGPPRGRFSKHHHHFRQEGQETLRL